MHSGCDEQRAAYAEDDGRLCGCLEAEWVSGALPVRCFALGVALTCDALTRRGYSAQKVEHNIECEIMQVCLDEVREAWDERQVVELYSDTAQQVDENVEVRRVAEAVAGGAENAALLTCHTRLCRAQDRCTPAAT